MDIKSIDGMHKLGGKLEQFQRKHYTVYKISLQLAAG